MTWSIILDEPQPNEIIGVPSTGTHKLFVQCNVTVDDGARPDSVKARVYRTDSATELIPADPDDTTYDLNYVETGASGDGPYSFRACITVQEGTRTGKTNPLPEVVLAVWAGRLSNSGTEYHGPLQVTLKAYNVYVDCPAFVALSKAAVGSKAKKITSKAKSSAKKKTAKKKQS